MQYLITSHYNALLDNATIQRSKLAVLNNVTLQCSTRQRYNTLQYTAVLLNITLQFSIK